MSNTHYSNVRVPTVEQAIDTARGGDKSASELRICAVSPDECVPLSPTRDAELGQEPCEFWLYLEQT